ncbi:MAG: zinc ABC transporter substrate-binding protein [Planctomycetes bacterium]|nr:zinc ABC transporter substrate-binding protein [Planctomycetota bacterium]
MKITILAALAGLLLAGRAEDKIQVVATTPELRDIAQQIGGERVEAVNLTRGPEDPHFVQARPSLIKATNKADVFIRNGMSLEVGFEQLVLTEARNPKIQPGLPTFVDVSREIPKLQSVFTGVIDRAQGDVHPEGNPHYLHDPMNAKIAARAIRDGLIAAAPTNAKDFTDRCDAFSKQIDVEMFGEKLVGRFSSSTLADALAQGKLTEFLKSREALADLGGWAGKLLPYSGKAVVSFHQNLNYFTNRFNFDYMGTLEPKPGIPPSASHLEELIARMKAKQAKVVFYNVFQSKKPVDKVCAETGASPVLFPHQVEATPAATTYIKMMESMVSETAAAFAKS